MQVALAKFNCSPVALLIQELVLGEGQALQKGDAAEMQYTGNLYTNQSFGKVITDRETRYCGKKKIIRQIWLVSLPKLVLNSFSYSLQVFESNRDGGKLYKLKLGRGKVIKVNRNILFVFYFPFYFICISTCFNLFLTLHPCCVTSFLSQSISIFRIYFSIYSHS